MLAPGPPKILRLFVHAVSPDQGTRRDRLDWYPLLFRIVPVSRTLGVRKAFRRFVAACMRLPIDGPTGNRSAHERQRDRKVTILGAIYLVGARQKITPAVPFPSQPKKSHATHQVLLPENRRRRAQAFH
jgi:hypothetical protein